MDPIDLTTRSEAGTALSQAQHDSNLTEIQTSINAIIAKLALLAGDDGVLVAGLVDTLNQIADGLITLAKLKALDAADYGKFIRANPATGAIEATPIVSDKQTDSTRVTSAGAQTALELSSFTFEDLPAGDVEIWVVVHAQRVSGANGGTISVKNGATSYVDIPTHVLDNGTQWTALPGIARIADFAGGDLTLDLVFETGEADSSVVFGVDGDSRFGRHVMIRAGL